MNRCVPAVVPLVLLLAAPIAAQTTESKPAPAPRVESVYNITTGETLSAPVSGKPTPLNAALKQVLGIRVRNLTEWTANNPGKPLHLFLAGVELKNVVAGPTSTNPKEEPDIVGLRLRPEVVDDDERHDTRQRWVQVLQIAKRDIPVDISVGPPGEAPFHTVAQIRLDVYPSYTWAVLVFYWFVALGIAYLARNSMMLRDMNGSPRPPYSLAKHQMALWFVVVVGAYLYIWLTTGLYGWVSTTALALIGISGTTGLAAVAMDASKRAERESGRAALEAELQTLDIVLHDPKGGLMTRLRHAASDAVQGAELTAHITPKLTRLNELKTLLAKPAPAAAASVGWFTDLLSDDTGVSFHRVQMAVWTVALAIVFVYAVKDEILMPVFDTTLLTLMGISSGTYLGFKFPERPA